MQTLARFYTAHKQLALSSLLITTTSSLAFLAARTPQHRNMSSSSPTDAEPTYPRIPYSPPSPGTSFPYTAQDLTPADSTPAPNFYTVPRFVTHIDDAAIASLRAYFSAVLPRSGRILDLATSWISHYPDEIEVAEARGEVEVVGIGMNAREMERNKVLRGRWALKDLNDVPEVGGWVGDEESQAPSQDIDATTCTVSIDYLTSPVPVLSSLLQRTKPGGSVHLVISNRCFPTKAVGRWLRVSEEERLKMVADYLHFGGWGGVEILVLSDGRTEGSRGGLAGMLGLGGGRDPLWVVRGRKESA